MSRRSTTAATNGNGKAETRRVRCAIYTRKSSEEGLDQEFNSLDAQREGAEAFIASQKADLTVLVLHHNAINPAPITLSHRLRMMIKMMGL